MSSRASGGDGDDVIEWTRFTKRARLKEIEFSNAPRKVTSISMAFDSITWAGAEGEVDNHPVLITFRQIPETFPKSNYPDRLSVYWTMSEADANGLPTEQEFAVSRRIDEAPVSGLVCRMQCSAPARAPATRKISHKKAHKAQKKSFIEDVSI